jgi:hypothetical protein
MTIPAPNTSPDFRREGFTSLLPGKIYMHWETVPVDEDELNMAINVLVPVSREDTARPSHHRGNQKSCNSSWRRNWSPSQNKEAPNFHDGDIKISRLKTCSLSSSTAMPSLLCAAARNYARQKCWSDGYAYLRPKQGSFSTDGVKIWRVASQRRPILNLSPDGAREGVAGLNLEIASEGENGESGEGGRESLKCADIDRPLPSWLEEAGEEIEAPLRHVISAMLSCILTSAGGSELFSTFPLLFHVFLASPTVRCQEFWRRGRRGALRCWESREHEWLPLQQKGATSALICPVCRANPAYCDFFFLSFRSEKPWTVGD